MFKKALIIFCVFTVVSKIIPAQSQMELDLLRKYAENGMRDGDYEFALEHYLQLYMLDKDNVDLNYKIGICYTETTIDKAKAIPYLEFVVGHNNYPPRSYYYLGRTYLYNYRFTEAVEALYEYKMQGVSEDLLIESDLLISRCYDALERINAPANVTFELLDTTINSEFDEYYPFVSQDQSSIAFTSNSTFIEDYQEYIANVFYAESKKGSWNSAISIPVNTFDNEEVIGYTSNGEKILVYANGDYFNHDIKMVSRKGSKFSDAPNSELPHDLNTDGIEMGACLSPDGNTLIFASNRRGGRGKLDLYWARKDVSGQWMAAENLGATINTEYDENFPSFSPDGKMLYFSSKGHPGVGEYDIYKSQYIDSMQIWTTPRNLGFPINTPLDNTTISFVDNRTAYIAANRKEGVGKLDIYKVTIDEDIQETYISGTLLIGSASNNVPYSEDFLKAYVTVYDTYGNIFGRFDVNPDGTFFCPLFPGEFKLEVKFDGYAKGYEEKLIIKNEDIGGFIQKTVYLNQ